MLSLETAGFPSMLLLLTLQVLSKSPPVKSSEQVADRAEPHECKQKVPSVTWNNTNLPHCMFSPLISPFCLYFSDSPPSRPPYMESCYFACNQIPRHFSLVENKVTEGHFWKHWTPLQVQMQWKTPFPHLHPLKRESFSFSSAVAATRTTTNTRHLNIVCCTDSF